MDYKWIEDINEFFDIADKWDQAVISMNDDNPFLLSDFIISWWEQYRKDLRLMIFIVLDGEKITGGVPLCKDKNGRIEYVGRWAANYTEFLFFGDKEKVWQHFLNAVKNRQDWNIIFLRRWRENYLPVKTKNTKGLFIDYLKTDCGYFINIPDKFSNYLQKLPKTLRYYLRRSEKEFSKLGEIELVNIKEKEKIEEVSSLYVKFSKDSFEARGRRSAFEDRRFDSFFKNVLNAFCVKGYLDANILTLNREIIAIHFGYTLKNNLNYIFPVFNKDYSGLNPGHLLIYKLVEIACKRESKVFNLYTGYQFYKEQWSDGKEDIVKIEIRPKCIRSAIRRKIALNIEHGLIEKIRKNTKLKNKILKCLSIFGRR